MRRSELNELCQAVAGGETKLVQNQDLLYTARVTACHGEQLTVEAFGHTFAWSAGHCRLVEEGTAPLGPPTSD